MGVLIKRGVSGGGSRIRRGVSKMSLEMGSPIVSRGGEYETPHERGEALCVSVGIQDCIGGEGVGGWSVSNR